MRTIARVEVVSFGFGHRPPPDPATITLDTRILQRDPHIDPTLRALTGRDPAVCARVLATPGARSLITNTAALVAQLLADAADQDTSVTVAVGCVGGRHRSVVLTDEIARVLTERGVEVAVTHLDVDRPVLAR